MTVPVQEKSADLAVRSDTHVPANQPAFERGALAKPSGFMAPASMAEAMTLADLLSKSQLIPDAFRGKPNDVLIVIEMGANIGIPPLMTLQSTAVIQGRPVLWGDVPLGLVRAHPSFVSIEEKIEGEGEGRVAYCKLVRVTAHGNLVATERSFSYATARGASLTNKDTYKLYPEDMLKRRARSRALADGASDILKGFSPNDLDYDVIEGEALDKATGKTLGATQTERVKNALAERAGTAQAAAPTPQAKPPLPDLSGKSDIEIGEIVASEAKARGIQPPTLREIVKTVGGGRLVRSTSTRILEKIFETPLIETPPE